MWPFKKRNLEDEFKSLLELNDKERMSIKSDEFNYIEQIKKAFKNNKKLNLEIPDFEFDTSVQIKNNRLLFEMIKEVIHEEIFCFEQSELKFSCFDATILAQQNLLERIGVKSLITLGYYSDVKEMKYFYENFQTQKFRLKNPTFHTKTINLHCWLTLADYTIIDVSLLSSLKEHGLHKDLDYRQFYVLDGQQQSSVKLPYYYHPQLVGTSYLSKIKM